MAVRAEGWKLSGLVKGVGIPAPSGPGRVGCVDLMHKLDGEEDSLLLRLFYPAAVDAVGEYAKWRPHKRYLKPGYLNYSKTTASGLVATVIDIFNSGMDVFKVPTRNQMFFFQPSQAQESLPSTVFHWESLQLVHQLIDTPHLMKVIPLGAGLSQG